VFLKKGDKTVPIGYCLTTEVSADMHKSDYMCFIPGSFINYTAIAKNSKILYRKSSFSGNLS
jgi:hypothetical protein